MLTAVSSPEPKVESNECVEGRRAWKNGKHWDENPYKVVKGTFSYKRRDWFAGWFAAKYEFKFGECN